VNASAGFWKATVLRLRQAVSAFVTHRAKRSKRALKSLVGPEKSISHVRRRKSATDNENDPAACCPI
jgi:hypothetical protein